MKKNKLNQIQYKFWIDTLLKHQSVEYNTTNYTFIVDQNLSVDILKRTYHQILLEYPPFSSVIKVENDVPYFISDENSCKVPFTIIEGNAESNLDQLISECVYLPFNLQEEYPCRFYVIHIKNCYYLVHVFHHIAIDGISLPMFFKRLGVIYNSLLKNTYCFKSQAEDLEAFNKSFERDFVTHYESDVSYWKDYIQNYPLSISFQKLGKDKVRPAALNFELGKNIHRQVLEFRDKRYTSLFRLYASVWALTVAKSTNTERLLVDHTLNMRPKNNEGLLGVFVNNLPLRFNFQDGDLSMLELFSAINQNMFEEKRHQYAFYHQIFHEIDKEKKQIPGGINVSFSYKTGYGHMALSLDGCDVRRYGHVDVPISNGLALLIDDDDEMSCSIRYGNEISYSFVKSLSITFQTILQQVLCTPSVRLSELHLLSHDAQQILISKENQRLRHINSPNSFLHLFEKMVLENHDKVAVVHKNHLLTYGRLDRMSNYVASFLIQNGITHRRVGLSTPKNENMIVAILGILKSGNVYVPIDYNLPKERIRFIIGDCNLSTIIGSIEVCEKLSSIIETHSFEEILNENLNDCSVEIFPTDEAYIIYTSGTTGKPKAIPIQHSMLCQAVLNTDNYLHLSSESKVSQFASISFDASLIEIFPVLGFGGTLILPTEREVKDPILFHEFLKLNQITFAYIPPVFLSNMPTASLPKLETIIVAGDSTLQTTVDKWCQRYRLINAYGPTESTIGATYAILQSDSMANDIGTPEQGVTCYVLDKYLNLLPDNALGELYIGGVKLTTGYINHPDLNKEKFIKNPFVSAEDALLERNLYLYKTGDLVVRREDGHLLFMGRSDFQVKLHGYRIELGEIETQISNYGHGIKEVSVLLYKGDNIKQLVAYVQVEDVGSISETDLRAFLRNRLPLYMVPSIIIPIKEFPCTVSGKIDRKRLPNPSLYVKLPLTINSTFTPTEKKLAEIWANLIPNQIFGVEDDFRTLGGDSMAVIQLSFSIQKEFGVIVRATDIYRCSTLRKIAEFIDKEAAKVITESDAELSPNQQGIWLHCAQSESIKDSYNLSISFSLPVETKISRFEKAINRLVERNNCFRTSFPLGQNRRPHVHVDPYIPFSVEECYIPSNELSNYLNQDKSISFNLSEGPLYRVKLYHLNNNTFYCSLVMHRLISDKPSLKLIRSVVSQYVSGKSINWDEYSGNYLAYTHDVNRIKETKEYHQNLLYWRNRLGSIQNIDILLQSEDDCDDKRASFVSCNLPIELCDKVSALCLSLSVPLYEFYCFSYLLLLAKVFHRSDFVIGYPYEKAPKTYNASAIGNFTCLAPICYRKQFNQYTFSSYLQELHTLVLDGQERFVFLDDLIKVLRAENHANQLQLISSIFSFDEDFYLSDVSTIQVAYGLEFGVLSFEEKFTCYAKYQSRVFTEKQITHFLSDYCDLIGMIVTNTERTISEYELSEKVYTSVLSNSLIQQDSQSCIKEEMLTEKPRTIAECMTLDILSRLLQTSILRINDNLFDFGLNSIQILEALEELAQIGIYTSVSSFYKNKTIKKILDNQQSTLCYWGTPYDPGKPIILIIGGFAYYKYGYNALTEALKSKYSLLVIEAYYESFSYKEYSFEELLQSYVNMLRPVLKDKELFGVIGLCIGGEIGLQLAYYLDKENIAHPKVFVIDGYANRGEFEDNIYIDDPSVTAEVNKERNRISMMLINTFHFNIYKGETHICLANKFTSNFYQNIGDKHKDANAYNKMKENFDQKAFLWKKNMPHCQIHYLHADHLHIYLEGPSNEMRKIIDQACV